MVMAWRIGFDAYQAEQAQYQASVAQIRVRFKLMWDTLKRQVCPDEAEDDAYG